MFGTLSQVSETYSNRQKALFEAGYNEGYSGTIATTVTFKNDLGEEVTQEINKYDRRTVYASGKLQGKQDITEGKPNRYAPQAEPVTLEPTQGSYCEGATVVRTKAGKMLGVFSPYQDKGYMVTNNDYGIQAVILTTPEACIDWLLSNSTERSPWSDADLVAAHDIMHGRVTWSPTTCYEAMVELLKLRRDAAEEF